MKIEFDINLKPDWLKSVAYNVQGQDFAVDTYPGVFSYGKIDKATDFLLQQIKFLDTDNVLDLGCGCGVIGLVAARLCQAGRVESVDIEPRAVALATSNVEKSKVENLTVYGSNGYDSVEKKDFDKIIINLPAQVAKPVQVDLMQGAFKHLKKGGQVYVVCQARLQRFVKRILKEVFGDTLFIGKESHFVVIKSIK